MPADTTLVRRRGRALPRSFYARNTLEVARDLLGTVLVHDTSAGRTSGRIVEVEAYVGEEDAACHAAAGLTPRTDPLYGPPGHAYVYFVYGMHWCFNAVTRPKGSPSAVLVRALEPLEGLPLMRRRRGDRPERELANGPGKLARALGIGPDQNRADLTRGTLTIVEADPVPDGAVVWGPRVGIRVAADLPYRAWVADSPHVSRGPASRAAGGAAAGGPSGSPGRASESRRRRVVHDACRRARGGRAFDGDGDAP